MGLENEEKRRMSRGELCAVKPVLAHKEQTLYQLVWLGINNQFSAFCLRPPQLWTSDRTTQPLVTYNVDHSGTVWHHTFTINTTNMVLNNSITL
jgi:hypothetical protein